MNVLNGRHQTIGFVTNWGGQSGYALIPEVEAFLEGMRTTASACGWDVVVIGEDFLPSDEAEWCAAWVRNHLDGAAALAAYVDETQTARLLGWQNEGMPVALVQGEAGAAAQALGGKALALLMAEGQAGGRAKRVAGGKNGKHEEKVGETLRHAESRALTAAEMRQRQNALTTQLLAALNEEEIWSALDTHLSRLGVRRLMVVFWQEAEPELSGQSVIFYSFGFEKDWQGQMFLTRQFPPPGWRGQTGGLCLRWLPLTAAGYGHGYLLAEGEDLSALQDAAQNLSFALHVSKLQQEAVEGKRMAEEADRLKSRFLSMVSHELRTPLNLIVGLSEILLRQKEGVRPPDATLWQDLERININAQHLGRLIGDVLDLVSSELGHLRLQHEPLDLGEVLAPVVVSGEQMAREKGLGWEANVPARGPYVMGDRTRLRQVVLNLLSNAVKFTFRGSVRLDVQVQDQQVIMAVRDTGMGIPPAEQDKIFSEFGRSDAAVRRGISGIGLGLAITKELVERQGGKISVYSSGKEGEGSTFSFAMPLLKPFSAELAAESGCAENGLPALLLTESVEDAVGLGRYLRGRGIQLEVFAAQPESAWLVHLLSRQVGALILDARLADRQGWQILSMLKRHAATENLPVLVCTTAPEQGGGAMLELDYQL